MLAQYLKYVDEIAVNLIAVFIVFVGRLLGFDTYSRIIRFFRLLRSYGARAFGRKTVILYTDCDDELHTSRALASRLALALAPLGLTVKVRVARDGVDLTRWPFPRSVRAIVLLITDVTQLSTRPKERDQVQKRMVKYVHKGGCLVLGHDVIYRRSRNERLQKLAGCVLDTFERHDAPITYSRVEAGPRHCENASLVGSLSESIELGDNEIVVGSWNSDVDFLYCWNGLLERPLVTRRTVDSGRVYWVNSGDSNLSGPPRALARPEPEFVKLLALLIVHS